MQLSEAIAAWKAANPFPLKVCVGSQCRNTTQAEYDAMAADRGQMWLDRQNAQDASDAEQVTAGQIAALVANLEAGTANPANAQKALAYLLKKDARVRKALGLA